MVFFIKHSPLCISRIFNVSRSCVSFSFPPGAMRRKRRLVFQVHQTKTLAAPRPPYHYKGTALQRAGFVQASGHGDLFSAGQLSRLQGERLLRRDKLQKGAHFLRRVVSLKKSFKICIARFRVFLAVVQHSVMFKSVFLHTFIIFVCWLQRHEKL
jgi:hypothetical protein